MLYLAPTVAQVVDWIVDLSQGRGGQIPRLQHSTQAYDSHYLKFLRNSDVSSQGTTGALNGSICIQLHFTANLFRPLICHKFPNG